MIRPTLCRAAFGVLIVLAAPRPAAAQAPVLPHGEAYGTHAAGKVDLELGYGEIFARWDPWLGAAHSYQLPTIGFRYGITSRWDVGVTDELFGLDGYVLGLSAWSVETRYRFAESAHWPVRLMLGADVLVPITGSDLYYPLRPRIVVERPFGPVSVIANLAVDFGVLGVLRDDLSPVILSGIEPSLAVTVRPHRRVQLGVETWSEPTDPYERKITGGPDRVGYLGASFSVETPRLWMQLDGAVGFVAPSDRLRFRLSIGVRL